MATNIPFYKMNGAGNEIIVADMRGYEAYIQPEAAIALAEKNAIPFDQLMEIRSPKAGGFDAGILIHNSDGSKAGACGNGMRCVVSYLSVTIQKNAFTFRTEGGNLTAEILEDGLIKVDMGKPKFGWEDIPLAEEFFDTTKIELQIGPIDAPVLHSPSVASMGNPHAIFWVKQDVNSYDLDRFGPMLENHPIFPERANITLAQVVSPEHIIVRTWERGAGLTLACGSAACAALVCAVRKEFTGRKATVTPPSGKDLTIEWDENNHVLMTGPAEFEFSGKLDPVTGAFERDPVLTA
jgi:diaminopimelate epimerase